MKTTKRTTVAKKGAKVSAKKPSAPAKKVKVAAGSAAKKSASKSAKAATGKKASDGADPNVWTLRLYVAGQTPKSLSAFANLKKACELHLPGRYKIEVIDLLKDPHLAQNDQILAIPTLVRKIPAPMKKIIGDLSNMDRFLIGFDLKPITG